MKNLLEQFNGKLVPAPNRRFRELIFFVHFYEGNRRLLKRHVDFVRDLGFDSFSFDLQSRPDDWSLKNGWKNFGIEQSYARQIQVLLQHFLDRPIIIFSFSNPTAAVIKVIAQMDRQNDSIRGLIADSGPSGHFVRSVLNLFIHQKTFAPLPVRAFLAPFFSLLWSPLLHRDIHEDLSKLRPGFPVLSIIGGQDPLIPPSHIQAVFERHQQLNWQTLTLPQGGHLNGLRDFGIPYKSAVEKFLNKTATLV